MPATPARIGLIINEFRRAIAGPDGSVAAKYGTLARDTDEPIETFFDTVADAQAMADERLALLSADRRLLEHDISGADQLRAIAVQPVIPTAAVIDDERGYDADALVVGMTIDLDADTASATTWG